MLRPPKTATKRVRYSQSVALRLRPYRVEDESAALAAHESMLSEDFHFLPFWEPDTNWTEFVRANLDLRHGVGAREFQVPGIQLAATVDGELVGRTSLRFTLNDFFATKGGHVGYGVLPAYRRRGYASEILRQALVVVRAEGVDRVLVTCSENNLASATVIEHNGGVLESILASEDGGPGLRRYWIE